jgi:hypothetical protein
VNYFFWSKMDMDFHQPPETGGRTATSSPGSNVSP